MKVAIILNAPYKIDNVAENNVIYTDGGYKNHKYLENKKTLAVIGDFDTLKRVPQNENIIKLEVEKNFTDGERAVCYANEIGAKSITIYGATEGRFEHVLGNLTLLKQAQQFDIDCKLDGKNNVIYLKSGKVELSTKKNTTISLIPYTDDCVITNSCGLYYPLEKLKLTKGDTRGISNIATKNKISFDVISGEVLVIISK